jgi:hypothetical protein
MSEIGISDAAHRLGVSEPAVRKMLGGRLVNLAPTGSPALVASADVDRVMNDRRTEALGRHPDSEAFALQVRRQLWPMEQVEYVTLEGGGQDLADGRQAMSLMHLPAGRRALKMLTPDAAAVFGRAAVDVAATDPKVFAASGACRWCYADATARIRGGLRPVDAAAYRILLGTDPCPKDRERWAREGAALRTRRDQQERQAKEARRKSAQQSARTAFAAAHADTLSAVSRLRAAARDLAAVDPAVGRQAEGIRARRRGGRS